MPPRKPKTPPALDPLSQRKQDVFKETNDRLAVIADELERQRAAVKFASRAVEDRRQRVLLAEAHLRSVVATEARHQEIWQALEEEQKRLFHVKFLLEELI